MRKTKSDTKKGTIVAVRVDDDTAIMLEEERKRRSKAARANVTRSELIRAILREAC